MKSKLRETCFKDKLMFIELKLFLSIDLVAEWSMYWPLKLEVLGSVPLLHLYI